ncbi:hypothetical protein BC936DRAFT_147459 [Jimgerdemannia flammicorona]|uniref:Uncharacterized protein n=1 Tax=Jimgerdemannia flammicorona TaxID=994334 RepID=A0A433D5A4_9FUNG|nr:hypothetical protein BC936DRAFT_147459 [Jimgerdemannia flammicorona]
MTSYCADPEASYIHPSSHKANSKAALILIPRNRAYEGRTFLCDLQEVSAFESGLEADKFYRRDHQLHHRDFPRSSLLHVDISKFIINFSPQIFLILALYQQYEALSWPIFVGFAVAVVVWPLQTFISTRFRM